MSDLLRITSMDTGKNYQTIKQPPQSETAFNIVDLNKVVKTNDNSHEMRQTNNSFEGDSKAQLSTELNISKDSSFIQKMMKDIVDEKALNTEDLPDASSKEFNEFVKNIFLTDKALSGDLVAQEKGITSFKGDLFNLLKSILETTDSQDLKNSVISFLRNLSGLTSQNEILNSIAENIRYLASLLAPSKTISENLSNLAEEFSKDNANINFTSLCDKANLLLNQALNSLIATDKTVSLVSLIKYNLSRFTDNPNMLTANFKSILDSINDEGLKQKFNDIFEKYIEGSNIPYPTKDALLADNQNYINTDKLAHLIADAMDSQKVLEQQAFNNTNVVKSINEMNNDDILSVADSCDKIKELLMMVVSSDKSDEVSKLLDAFSETKDLTSLINRLRFILNNISDADTKSLLASKLNIILTSLTKNADVVYQKPTSLENLVDFMAKALGNENIKYLGIVDPNVLVHNMLSSPGVFTPLIHLVMPLQIDDLRAFGELWVDKHAEENSDTSDSTHMFLTFDIENAGLFELEIFSKDKKLDISLFCPKEFVKSMSLLKLKIPAIVNEKGFYSSSTKISELTNARTLTQVFPELVKRRSGINVKV